MRLEDQLSTDPTITEKVKTSDIYAQNLYAALCNTQWKCADINTGIFSITWRGAGSIVANIKNNGDYLDWYCSGICKKKLTEYINGFTRCEVNEGTVTHELEQDIAVLGWKIVESNQIFSRDN